MSTGLMRILDLHEVSVGRTWMWLVEENDGSGQWTELEEHSTAEGACVAFERLAEVSGRSRDDMRIRGVQIT